MNQPLGEGVARLLIYTLGTVAGLANSDQFGCGFGATGTLIGPDGTGLATYTTSASLPADAAGTWTVGLEARRSVTVHGASVTEAAQNVVFDFSVDGSAVRARRAVVDGGKCSNGAATSSMTRDASGNANFRCSRVS